MKKALVDEFMLDVKPEATMAVPGNGAGLNCRLEAIDQVCFFVLLCVFFLKKI